MTSLLAHTGHWVVDLLYLSPLVALGLAVGAGKLRERRRGRSTER